ncbi:methylated-DNA--[protein]-cysteine S-methyltransferase [Kocuria palustris]|uniref:methylated-DNA--[protein]-cysteine S-methyltransferase n=1 Tax=Kocuria palustris TaxID=71999 RepID=UPI002469B30F|nr:methylated-DNA--[protein]-cysteine S-methyltransferase [Kocuria palustris]MDH5150726.1 methylated-DNA--[protein]-cysteine S-methyltransferase [Kocuria palustris]
MTEKTPTPCPGHDLATEQDTLFPIESYAVADLRSRLSAQAGERGLVDVAYRTLETPVGPLLLAATETGLVRVAFEREGFDAVLESLAQRISPRVLEAPHRLDAAAAELDEYFAGRRHSFDVPLDFALSSGFRRSVQTSLLGIDYGRTRSYKEIAELVGSPRAVRAVGTACATNPLPVVLPCHRVLRSDGGLGGYIGGLEAKTVLLSLEKAA